MPEKRLLSGSGRTGGDLSDRIPPKFPSILPAHCLHTRRRATSRNSQSGGPGADAGSAYS